MNRNDLPASNATCKVCGRKYRRCKRCIEMRTHGIEMWREYCDSIECYQTYIFTQEDISKITAEQYERVIAFELPEGRKPVKEIQDKLDNIKEMIYKKNLQKEVSGVSHEKWDEKPAERKEGFKFGIKSNRKDEKKMNVKN